MATNVYISITQKEEMNKIVVSNSITSLIKLLIQIKKAETSNSTIGDTVIEQSIVLSNDAKSNARIIKDTFMRELEKEQGTDIEINKQIQSYIDTKITENYEIANSAALIAFCDDFIGNNNIEFIENPYMIIAMAIMKKEKKNSSNENAMEHNNIARAIQVTAQIIYEWYDLILSSADNYLGIAFNYKQDKINGRYRQISWGTSDKTNTIQKGADKAIIDPKINIASYTMIAANEFTDILPTSQLLSDVFEAISNIAICPDIKTLRETIDTENGLSKVYYLGGVHIANIAKIQKANSNYTVDTLENEITLVATQIISYYVKKKGIKIADVTDTPTYTNIIGELLRGGISKLLKSYKNIIILRKLDNIVLWAQYNLEGNTENYNELISKNFKDNVNIYTNIYKSGEKSIRTNGKDTVLQGNIYSTVIVMDTKYYEKAPSFSYKPLLAMKKRGTHFDDTRVLLGRTLSNVDMYYDLQKYSMATIYAASRSGKGVMTLSILASIMAAGQPVIYLDGKPDMSIVMWKLAQQRHSKVMSLEFQRDIHNADFNNSKDWYVKGGVNLNVIDELGLSNAWWYKSKDTFTDSAEKVANSLLNLKATAAAICDAVNKNDKVKECFGKDRRIIDLASPIFKPIDATTGTFVYTLGNTILTDYTKKNNYEFLGYIAYAKFLQTLVLFDRLEDNVLVKTLNEMVGTNGTQARLYVVCDELDNFMSAFNSDNSVTLLLVISYNIIRQFNASYKKNKGKIESLTVKDEGEQQNIDTVVQELENLYKTAVVIEQTLGPIMTNYLKSMIDTGGNSLVTKGGEYRIQPQSAAADKQWAAPLSDANALSGTEGKANVTPIMPIFIGQDNSYLTVEGPDGQWAMPTYINDTADYKVNLQQGGAHSYGALNTKAIQYSVPRIVKTYYGGRGTILNIQGNFQSYTAQKAFEAAYNSCLKNTADYNKAAGSLEADYATRCKTLLHAIRPNATQTDEVYYGISGYWAISDETGKALNNMKILKSYLVLNENDFDPSLVGKNIPIKDGDKLSSKFKTYTGPLLMRSAEDDNKSIDTDVIMRSIIQNDLVINGQANAAVGFPGLMDLLSEGSEQDNVKKSMELGYDIICKAFKRTPFGAIYAGSFIDYIFDYSFFADSFDDSNVIEAYNKKKAQGVNTVDNSDFDWDSSEPEAAQGDNTVNNSDFDWDISEPETSDWSVDTNDETDYDETETGWAEEQVVTGNQNNADKYTNAAGERMNDTTIAKIEKFMGALSDVKSLLNRIEKGDTATINMLNAAAEFANAQLQDVDAALDNEPDTMMTCSVIQEIKDTIAEYNAIKDKKTQELRQ